MKTVSQKILSCVLAIAGLGLASPAHAILVSYTVDGVAAQQLTAPVTPPADAPWGVTGYPGDTVEIQSYTGTLDLAVGTTVQKVNSLLWTVNYTYGGTSTDSSAWNDVQFNLDTARQIQIGGATALLTQAATLTAGWDNDYLDLQEGNTVTIYDQGYRIDTTPLAVPSTGATNFDGSNPWVQPSQDLYAKFVVTAVSGGMAVAPEPGSIAALLGLILISCGSPMVSRLRVKDASC